MTNTTAIIQKVINHIEGRIFDFWNGIDTHERICQEKLKVDSPNKKHATKYDATPLKTLRGIFKNHQFSKNDTFVDFGSGKGRALIVAAQYSFRQIIGVEYSSELCEIANKNLAKKS